MRLIYLAERHKAHMILAIILMGEAFAAHIHYSLLDELGHRMMNGKHR